MIVITDPHYCRTPLECDGTYSIAIGEELTRRWWLWVHRTPVYVLMHVESNRSTGERVWVPLQTFTDVATAMRALDAHRRGTLAAA